MLPDDAFLQVHGAFSILLLLAAVQYVYIPTLVEEYRQRIFDLRKRLFLLVADKRIEPTHPAYTQVRNQLNGFLQMAARITFSRLVLGVVLMKMDEDEGLVENHHEELGGHLESLGNAELRQELENIRWEALHVTLHHVSSVSVTCWIVMPIAHILLSSVEIFSTLGRRFGNFLEQQAEDAGRDDHDERRRAAATA